MAAQVDASAGSETVNSLTSDNSPGNVNRPKSDNRPKSEARRNRATEFVATLDATLQACAARGDLSAYRAAFQPLHPKKFANNTKWLTKILSRDTSWTISSVVREVLPVDDIDVVLLETTFRPEGDGSGDRDDAWTSMRYVAVRTPNKTPIGLLDVEVHAPFLGASPLSERGHARHGCEACNYEIRASDDWLMVPHVPERVGCMEAISFYSLREDLVVDSSIHVVGDGPAAMPTLSAYLKQRLRGGGDTPSASKPEVQEWLPAFYRDAELRGLSGARSTVTDGKTNHAVVHAARFGPVLYMFTALGSVKDAQHNGERVEALLGTFMLRETDIGRLRRVLRPITMHTGGKLVDETRYENSRYGISFDGPEGWMPKLRCGGDLFHVSYRCVSTARTLAVRSLAPPMGRVQWTQLTASWSVDHAMHREGMEVLEDSGWQSSEDGSSWQRDVLAQPSASDGSRTRPDGRKAPAARACRAVLPRDGGQLIIMDASGKTEEIAAIREMFDRLERDR